MDDVDQDRITSEIIIPAMEYVAKSETILLPSEMLVDLMICLGKAGQTLEAARGKDPELRAVVSQLMAILDRNPDAANEAVVTKKLLDMATAILWEAAVEFHRELLVLAQSEEALLQFDEGGDDE